MTTGGKGARSLGLYARQAGDTSDSQFGDSDPRLDWLFQHDD